MTQTRAADLLAALLQYPGPGYLASVERARGSLAAELPETAALLRQFGASLASLTPTELEEMFTGTFDLNPVCSLEVGWHLFGEEYARGSFLVRMRGELRRVAVPESTELPDHLMHLVPLLERLPAAEAAELASSAVLPALEQKMLPALSGKQNPFEMLLRAIAGFVRARYVPLPAEVSHE